MSVTGYLARFAAFATLPSCFCTLLIVASACSGRLQPDDAGGEDSAVNAATDFCMPEQNGSLLQPPMYLCGCNIP
jgi:hypothetical protein